MEGPQEKPFCEVLFFPFEICLSVCLVGVGGGKVGQGSKRKLCIKRSMYAHMRSYKYIKIYQLFSPLWVS